MVGKQEVVNKGISRPLGNIRRAWWPFPLPHFPANAASDSLLTALRLSFSSGSRYCRVVSRSLCPMSFCTVTMTRFQGDAWRRCAGTCGGWHSSRAQRRRSPSTVAEGASAGCPTLSGKPTLSGAVAVLRVRKVPAKWESSAPHNLRRKARLPIARHAKRGVVAISKIDIRPSEVAQFLLAQTGEEERRENRLFVLVALGEDSIQFVLAVGRRTTLCFHAGIFQGLELRARVGNGQVPFTDQEIKKNPKHTNFIIDRAGRDAPVRMLVAGLTAPDRLVVVDIRARDRLDEHLPTQNSLHMIERRRIPLHGARLIRRVHPHVLQEHVNGIGKQRERCCFRRLRWLAIRAKHQFTDKLVPFPALRLHGLARRLPCNLAPPPAAFPPFDKIVGSVAFRFIAARWRLVPRVTRGDSNPRYSF